MSSAVRSKQAARKGAHMFKDDRELLEVLKFELAFLKDGGYGRSVRTPWKATSIFQDSPTCINFADPHRSRPCDECHLLDFVPAERRSETVPCHHIPLNGASQTVQSLAEKGYQAGLEGTVAEWLQATIKKLEHERAAVNPVAKS